MPDQSGSLCRRELMELAVDIGGRSRAESDGRIHPMVGAVVTMNGHVLSTGFRGELKTGAHAEESAFAKLSLAQSAGTTVYTTLEPCTTRGKMPCTQLLLTRRVAEVVIGMLDPNPDIRGQGEWLLENYYISVSKFEPDLVRTIKAQNAEFIDYMSGLGITILQPQDGERILADPVFVKGTYRVHPRPGDKIVLFGRRGFTYYPQAPISWDRDKRIWQCDRVWLSPQEMDTEYGIVIARVSEDMQVWLRSYSNVHALTTKWIGAEMPTLPPGFETLASVNVIRADVTPISVH